MSLIAEKTVGVSYEMSVYHLGVAFAWETKNESAYGHSFRIEHSHMSGAIHTKCMTAGQRGFRDWLNKHSDILTTSVDYHKFGNKQRVISAAIKKIEHAAARYLLEEKKEDA